uniref:Uncharacterized protein n=1 Tax=Anguilla anguilla TaxID=7936 RepID=A0A0E9Q8P4_ANGAN
MSLAQQACPRLGQQRFGKTNSEHLSESNWRSTRSGTDGQENPALSTRPGRGTCCCPFPVKATRTTQEQYQQEQQENWG